MNRRNLIKGGVGLAGLFVLDTLAPIPTAASTPTRTLYTPSVEFFLAGYATWIDPINGHQFGYEGNADFLFPENKLHALYKCYPYFWHEDFKRPNENGTMLVDLDKYDYLSLYNCVQLPDNWSIMSLETQATIVHAEAQRLEYWLHEAVHLGLVPRRAAGERGNYMAGWSSYTNGPKWQEVIK
jgi:hypothetical protein